MLAQTVAGLRHFGVIDSLRSTLQHNYLIESSRLPLFPSLPSPHFPSCSLALGCLNLPLSNVSSPNSQMTAWLLSSVFFSFFKSRNSLELKAKYAVSGEHWSVNGEPCTALTAASWNSPGTCPSRWCLPWCPLASLPPAASKRNSIVRRVCVCAYA